MFVGLLIMSSRSSGVGYYGWVRVLFVLDVSVCEGGYVLIMLVLLLGILVVLML